MAVLLTSGGWIVAAALTTLVVTKSDAANAVRNANLWSRRTREARSCLVAAGDKEASSCTD